MGAQGPAEGLKFANCVLLPSVWTECHLVIPSAEETTSLVFFHLTDSSPVSECCWRWAHAVRSCETGGHLGDQLPGDVSGCSFILLCGHPFPRSAVTVSLSSRQHRACLLPYRCRQDGSTGIGKDCTTCYTQTLVLPALGAHAHAR